MSQEIKHFRHGQIVGRWNNLRNPASWFFRCILTRGAIYEREAMADRMLVSHAKARGSLDDSLRRDLSDLKSTWSVESGTCVFRPRCGPDIVISPLSITGLYQSMHLICSSLMGTNFKGPVGRVQIVTT
jgi:hypothetical protein